MEAIIKIVTAENEFNQDQMDVIRRVVSVLEGHNLSIKVTMQTKIVLSNLLTIKKESA